MKKVLLVDDEPAHIAAWSFVLADAGYDVHCAFNGEEALQDLEHDMPDVVVTDWMMPVMDGAALCRRLKAHPRWRDIPVLVYTCARSNFRALPDTPYEACLRKPAVLEVFLSTVEQLCSSRHH